MTIHPVPASAVPHTLPFVRVDAPADGPRGDASLYATAAQGPSGTTGTDTTATDTTVYDSVWTSESDIPSKQPDGFEKVMVGDGKILVVLAVILIIWIGLLGFLFRTDRRIRSLEREIEQDR